MSKISEFFTPDMMMAVGFFIAGHALGWFAGNAQFVWEFWKDKPVLATVLMGTPAGLCFWYGTKYCMSAVGELWSVRFIAAVLSYLVFPFFTWYFLGESIFTLKTMLCIGLAFLILAIQIWL